MDDIIDVYEILDNYVDTSKVVPLKQYNSIELFAGAGGMALGFENAGLNSVGLVENNKPAVSTLKFNRPNWYVISEDINNVVDNPYNYFSKDLSIDVISGGFPCQSFSAAGRRRGLEDARGTLFYSFAKTIDIFRPPVFIGENVKGLVTHDNGKTLLTVIDILTSIGYDVSYRILNAFYYDVAQKRQRIIISGVRKDLKIKFYYPIPLKHTKTLNDVLRDVPVSVGTRYSDAKKSVMDLVPPGGCCNDLPLDIAKKYMGKLYYSAGKGSSGIAKRLSWDAPSPTLTCSPSQKITERCHPDETRPLTVREYARIQSFPDDWVFMGSITNQYKQIGNAVPVNLAKMIGLSVINTLNQI